MVIQNVTGLQLIIDQPVTPVTTTVPPTTNGSVVEPADTPRNATPNQIANSLRFRIFDFQSIQVEKRVNIVHKGNLRNKKFIV